MKKMELIILGVIAFGVVGVGYMWATAPKPADYTIDEPGHTPGKTAPNAGAILTDAYNAISGQLPAVLAPPTHHDHVAGFKT